MSPDENDAARPVLRIVSGSPTPEELAVVTAIVTATGSGGTGDSAPRARRGSWNDPALQHRRPLLPGPNAWRSAHR